MTIGELATSSGLSVSAIRFYQRRGLLPPRDVVSGWQRYGSETLTRLAVIELAKRTGFTLDEVAVLLHAMDAADSPAAAWQAMLQARLTEIDAQIDRLHATRRLLTEALYCECLTFDHADLMPAALGWATGTATATRPSIRPPGSPSS